MSIYLMCSLFASNCFCKSYSLLLVLSHSITEAKESYFGVAHWTIQTNTCSFFSNEQANIAYESKRMLRFFFVKIYFYFKNGRGNSIVQIPSDNESIDDLCDYSDGETISDYKIEKEVDYLENNIIEEDYDNEDELLSIYLQNMDGISKKRDDVPFTIDCGPNVPDSTSLLEIFHCFTSDLIDLL